MTNVLQSPQITKPLIPADEFINHQLDHYQQRLMDAKDAHVRFWLRKELFNLKQSFFNYYN